MSLLDAAVAYKRARLTYDQAKEGQARAAATKEEWDKTLYDAMIEVNKAANDLHEVAAE